MPIFLVPSCIVIIAGRACPSCAPPLEIHGCRNSPRAMVIASITMVILQGDGIRHFEPYPFFWGAI
jgi:hypothetical protein